MTFDGQLRVISIVFFCNFNEIQLSRKSWIIFIIFPTFQSSSSSSSTGLLQFQYFFIPFNCFSCSIDYLLGTSNSRSIQQGIEKMLNKTQKKRNIFAYKEGKRSATWRSQNIFRVYFCGTNNLDENACGLTF